MDVSKVAKILKVCDLIAQMPSGGGWVSPSEILRWSSIPHATTYRYLEKMVKLEYLKMEKRAYRDKYSHHYKITNEGIDYLNDFKEMFA